jgi:hypothetical protein
MLLFAPMVEVVTPRASLTIESRRIAADEWQLDLSTDGVSKLVQIEGADGILLSDNYFPLVVGMPRTVQVRALEKKGHPILLNISSLDAASSTEVPLVSRAVGDR